VYVDDNPIGLKGALELSRALTKNKKLKVFSYFGIGIASRGQDFFDGYEENKNDDSYFLWTMEDIAYYSRMFEK
jgi:hypothetical protein